MQNLASKKKENSSRMDRFTQDLPQLSNEMQLSIMNKVKSGELSIEDALNLARRDQQQLLSLKNQNDEELQPSQYNFSVHKHNRYRWQKRVLQMDFKTKLLCSIQKGIVKRQLPFSLVKSCDDGAGSRFSISFKGHHDYELEATSLEDKHKIMQLMNQIIYENIYSDPAEGNTKTCKQPLASHSLREGVLLLHRGGLASFRWVKYEVQLHRGQLTLSPLRRQEPTKDGLTSVAPVSTVIHLSDGDTSVQCKFHSPDIFTLVTHKNEYNFRIPASDQTTTPGAVQRERDAWVQAIDKLCMDWKRKSMGELMFVGMKDLCNISIGEESSDADLQSNGETSDVQPAAASQTADLPTEGGSASLAVEEDPKSPSAFQTVPKPRIFKDDAVQDPGPDVPPPVQQLTTPTPVPSSSPISSLPLPVYPAVTHSKSPSESLSHESGTPVAKGPLPSIPPPPPLPRKLSSSSRKARTKAFHWDVVSSDKIDKSMWKQGSSRKIEIETSRLFEQFAIKELGTFKLPDASSSQNIMLNEKIAHNFNIFLKSFPVQPQELKDKLYIINEEEGGLSDEHITSLRRYVPTSDDVEMYKSHKGPVAELHIVDQYMMEMCNIPGLSTQLDLLLTLRELPISMSDLQPLINQKTTMCTQLNNCKSFVSVLEYLLAIGNYLNDNARKEKAKGFRLSSLAKLSQFRGRDKNFTLLHALVEQIMFREPCLATFTQELAEFETVPGASIKGLTAEVDVLKNELQKVIHYRKMSKKRNAGIQHPTFLKDLKVVIEKYKANLMGLTRTCEEMKKLYSVILEKFGEPANQDSMELFGLISQFVYDFKTAKSEII